MSTFTLTRFSHLFLVEKKALILAKSLVTIAKVRSKSVNFSIKNTLQYQNVLFECEILHIFVFSRCGLFFQKRHSCTSNVSKRDVFGYITTYLTNFETKLLSKCRCGKCKNKI